MTQEEVCLRTLETEKEIPARTMGKAKRIVRFIEGRTVLDVGCGAGNLTEEYRKRGFLVTGIDTDQKLIAQARKKGGLFRVGDLFKENEETKTDTLIMADVLEHMENPEQAISKAFRLLNVGGTLILSVPAFYFLYSDYDRSIGHFQRWEKEGITDLLRRNGFKVVASEYYDFLGFWAWLINCTILRRNTGQLKGRLQNTVIQIQNTIAGIMRPPIGSTLIIKARRMGGP